MTLASRPSASGPLVHPLYARSPPSTLSGEGGFLIFNLILLHASFDAGILPRFEPFQHGCMGLLATTRSGGSQLSASNNSFPVKGATGNEGEEPAWYAWVPFLNLWLMTKLAQKDVIWFILLFIPFVNIVIIIIDWMAIAERLGYESWWGILMIVPFVDFYILWRFAFGQP